MSHLPNQDLIVESVKACAESMTWTRDIGIAQTSWTLEMSDVRYAKMRLVRYKALVCAVSAPGYMPFGGLFVSLMGTLNVSFFPLLAVSTDPTL